MLFFLALNMQETELEQLERLRSEDTPQRLMITHTVESYCQNKTKSKQDNVKVTNLKNLPKFPEVAW